MEDLKEQFVKLSPPWYTYHRKIQALFGRDPEIHIRELAEVSPGKYTYMILVDNESKAEAIKAILINPQILGNIEVKATILGPSEDSVKQNDNIDIVTYETAFRGNPVFSKVVSCSYGRVFEKSFCIFKKQVIQFWNDDLSDYYGNYNGLAEDIAREIFEQNHNIQFCTDCE